MSDLGIALSFDNQLFIYRKRKFKFIRTEQERIYLRKDMYTNSQLCPVSSTSLINLRRYRSSYGEGCCSILIITLYMINCNVIISMLHHHVPYMKDLPVSRAQILVKRSVGSGHEIASLNHY